MLTTLYFAVDNCVDTTLFHVECNKAVTKSFLEKMWLLGLPGTAAVPISPPGTPYCINIIISEYAAKPLFISVSVLLFVLPFVLPLDRKTG